MSVYKWFLNKIILPTGNILLSGNYLGNIEEWRHLAKKSENELLEIQNKKLAEILQHAKKTVPFYKNISATELNEFPILTKEILRQNRDDLNSEDYDIKNLDKHYSSGSTGVQSVTYMTKDHTNYLRSLQTYWWELAGYELGDHLLQFGISQNRSALKKLKDFFYRCTYVKAFGLSPQDFERLTNGLESKKNLVIAGYPSVINQLALYCKKSHKSLMVKSVICFGDKLFDHYLKNIHSAFGENIKVIDTYGCAEGLLMAVKTDENYYNIMSPHVKLEIVDDNGQLIKDGEMGNVLVTCLTNKAMPLIRYKLGDLAINLPKDQYPKTRQLNYPLLKKVIGRETDVVKTNNGTTLNVHSFTGVLEYYQQIRQYKIIQTNLDEITLQYVSEDSFDESQISEINSKLLELTQNSIAVSFKRVDEIPPYKSGKPQIIESYLK